MGVFKVTVVYFLAASSQDKAEEEIVKLVGTFHHSLSAEDVTGLPSAENVREYQDNDIVF